MRDPYFYAMKEGGKSAAIKIPVTEAGKWNRDGFGIFWTVQDFHEKRQKMEVKTINGFAIDMDSGTKEEQLSRIRKGLLPTWIIESARGFHVYWLFKEPMQVKYSEDLDRDYKAVVQNKLIPFYNADERAKDLARLLRAPWCYHLKDPKNPFMIKPIVDNDIFYDWNTVDRAFEDLTAKKTLVRQEREISKVLKIKMSDKLFDDVYKIPCREALEKISGHPIVRGENFSFRRNANGNYNILVDGKGTSCWIDRDNKIGSLDKGGPTIWQWLHWYGNSHKEIYKFIKESFLV